MHIVRFAFDAAKNRLTEYYLMEDPDLPSKILVFKCMIFHSGTKRKCMTFTL